jgi:hypothetical protein
MGSQGPLRVSPYHAAAEFIPTPIPQEGGVRTGEGLYQGLVEYERLVKGSRPRRVPGATTT